MTFKDEHTFETRQIECRRIRSKYPDRYPVIVEVYNGFLSGNNLKIDKRKYLFPNISIGQIINIIRTRMKVREHQGLFFLVNSKALLPTQELLSKVYEDNKDPDGFLYINISAENAFG